MRNPVRVVRENAQMAKEALVETYEEHKTHYAFCAGSIATSVACVLIIKKLEKPPIVNTNLGWIQLDWSTEQICESLRKNHAIDITNKETGNLLSLLTTDYVQDVA